MGKETLKPRAATCGNLILLFLDFGDCSHIIQLVFTDMKSRNLLAFKNNEISAIDFWGQNGNNSLQYAFIYDSGHVEMDFPGGYLSSYIQMFHRLFYLLVFQIRHKYRLFG